MKRLFSLVVALLMVFSLAATAQTPATPYIEAPENYRSWGADNTPKDFDRTATSQNGMAASSKYEASLIGLRVLEAGGNAVDAAVAMGFALGVCEPFTSGLGGGGFMTIYLAEQAKPVFIDFREVAPGASAVEQYLDDKGAFVENSSSVGGLAIGVPGETAGLLHALETYGTMSREEVMRPAADMAEQGWTSTTYYNTSVGWGYQHMVDEKNKPTALGEIFLDENNLPPEIGTVVNNPGLAKALNLIIEKGRDGFYQGEVAQAVVDAVQGAGGVMTLEDLANYQVHELEPVTGSYKGYEIVSAPSPSSGGASFIQIMNLLENFDVYEKDSVEQIHLLSEIHKLIYADRGQYMADSKFVKVPLKGLTSKDYAAALAKKIDMTKAQDFAFDDPWTYEGSDTNGSVVVDAMGNMVALTKTINYYWGSGVAAKEYGIVLNNQMDDFSFDKESVNVVLPGKTPLSSMTPTVIFKDGKPAMLLSAPGGAKIFTTLTQLFTNVVDYGMTAEEAIKANRFIDIWGSLEYDAPDLPQETVDKLAAMGHNMSNKNGSRFALPAIIVIDENGEKSGSVEYIDEGVFLDGCALGY